jgi:YD repeat-containing protein
VGKAGMLGPDEGAQVVRRARLVVGAEPGLGFVKFQWRRGPDSTQIYDVALNALTTSAGAAWTKPWQPLPSDDGYTTWDVGKTLGQAGPVQVRAQVSANASGTGAYDTQWVTLTLDPDADGAATAEVGPGSVNLLTGDHNLSVTDAEEFGISLVRTASSRDTDTGLQMQVDKLTTAQQQVTALDGFTAGNAVLSKAEDKFHTGPIDGKAASSLKITPSGTSADSYAVIGGGSTLMSLQPERRYRFSGWVYAEPGGGGTTLPTGGFYNRQLKMTLFVKTPAGYSEPVSAQPPAATADPTIANAWQRVSFDATIPKDATEAFVRLYNGFDQASGHVVYWDDLSVREVWSPFGPQWSTGTTDAATGTAYTRLTRPYDDVVSIQLTGGGEIWFSSGNGTKWWPQPGAEDLELTQTSDSTWRLTELDGTTTDFTRDPQKSSDFTVSASAPPGATNASRHVYDPSTVGQARLWRIIAPIEDGVDGWPTNRQACNPQKAAPGAPPIAPGRGCEVMELRYATGQPPAKDTLGSFPGQVEAVSLWTTDPAGNVNSVDVARYQYDDQGRLRKVWDPRIGTSTSTGPGPGTLVTIYEYDPEGRLTSVTAPGEEPYRFTYGAAGAATQTGTGDLIDNSAGRLLKVSRRSLLPETTDQWAPSPSGDNVSTVVYGVPLTRAAGGPYDLGPTQLATWAQSDGPTDATAVFGPQDPPTVTTATATTPGRDGYKPATVHYLNASGREVNTASPAGLNAPAEGYIDTTEYDRFGNIVRTLDASNRLLALLGHPGNPCKNSQGTVVHCLTDWAIPLDSPAALANLLDSRTEYSEDGLDTLATRGPAQRLATANNPDALVTLSPVTRSFYDEGKPDGQAYHLLTQQIEGGMPPGGDLRALALEKDPQVAAATLQDPSIPKNGYTPAPGVAPLDGSSGWVHKQPTSVTVDAGGPAPLTSTVQYDTKGRVIRSSKPGSTGADPYTTLSVLYTASAAASDPDCRNRPEWAGQPCKTMAAGPATGHDASRMATNLPVKHVQEYNRYGSPTRVTESATGPIAGTSTTQSRTTVTTYDAADRVDSVQITGTAAGNAVLKTTTKYDTITGEVTENQSVNTAGTVVSAVKKTFDKLGRVVTYTDGSGATTTTKYDRYGQPTEAKETVTDTLGTRTIGSVTYTYDRAKDPRGYLTSFTDSVAGKFEAQWGPDGQLQNQTLPGGVKLTIDYDPARVPVKRTYTEASTQVVIASDQIVENHRGQWVRHTTAKGRATRDYSYERLGQLAQVKDR